MRDSRVLTDEVEFFDPLTMDQVAQARKTVCRAATDAADATELMLMLGIHPSQDGDHVPTTGMLPISANKMV